MQGLVGSAGSLAYYFIEHVIPNLLSVFLGAVLAIQVFYGKKRWERREQAYQEIISALYDMVQYYKIKKADYGQEDSYRDTCEAELFPDYMDACSVIRKATDIGFLYVSKKAFKVLVELKNSGMLNPENEPKYEVYRAEYEKHKQALDSLIDIAKKELKLL